MNEFSRPFQLPDSGGVAVGYDEVQTREYFSWIGKQNGVRRSGADWVTGDLAVFASTPPAMSVDVVPGGVWINGAGHTLTEKTTYEIAAAHVSYERIDSVVARLSVGAPDSAIVLAILQGDYAAVGTSVPKALTQTATTWELRLATVLVSPGVASIQGTGSTLISDTRLSSVCGVAAAQMGFVSLDPSGNLLTGGKKIILSNALVEGVATPGVSTDAANKGFVDDSLAAFVPTGSLIGRTYLTSGSGTHVLNSKTKKIYVVVVGGGANGGNVSAGAGSNQAFGGGSGGIVHGSNPVTGATAVTYVVGAAQANTSISLDGSLFLIAGGATSQNGGTATGGIFRIPGGHGGMGHTSNGVSSGTGSSTPYGHGGANTEFTDGGGANGDPAVGYGCGGGGAAKVDAPSAYTGGAGAGGLIIIEEYA